MTIKHCQGTYTLPVLIRDQQGTLLNRSEVIVETAHRNSHELFDAQSGAIMTISDDPDTELVGWGDLSGPAHTASFGRGADFIVPAAALAELRRLISLHA